MIRFTVPGRPVPYVRTTQRQKFVDRSYHRYQEFKNHVAWLGKLATKEQLNGPVAIEIDFYMTGKGRGDLDNLIKGVLDSLNKICFADDSQIVEIKARKWRVLDKDDQRVEVKIWPIDQLQEENRIAL